MGRAKGSAQSAYPRRDPSGVCFYGVEGSLLAACGGESPDYDSVYFAGKLIWEEEFPSSPRPVVPDRLGSIGAKYFPYGQEASSTWAEHNKFATYFQDSTTNLNYARNRYYSSTLARFTTPDPYRASGGPADPQSWNRYSYVQNDPVNFLDPAGLDKCPAGSEATCIDVVATALDVDPLASAFIGLLIMRFRVPFELERLPPEAYPKEPEPEPDPECFARLKYRPINHVAGRVGLATHAFWWVQGRTGQQYIISAGPIPEQPRGGEPQYLEFGKPTPGTANGQDNSDQPTAWNSGLSPANCDGVDRILAAAAAFPKQEILYRAVRGPNSNSAARYIGNVGGFFPNSPPMAWGWGTDIGLP